MTLAYFCHSSVLSETSALHQYLFSTHIRAAAPAVNSSMPIILAALLTSMARLRRSLSASTFSRLTKRTQLDYGDEGANNDPTQTDKCHSDRGRRIHSCRLSDSEPNTQTETVPKLSTACFAEAGGHHAKPVANLKTSTTFLLC